MLTQTQEIQMLINRAGPMNLAQIIGEEISEHAQSKLYKEAESAAKNYLNRSTVQTKMRARQSRSNTKMEHGFVQKLISQKANTLLAQPFSIDTDSQEYGDALSAYFDDSTRHKIKRFAADGVRSGIGWLHPYISEEGELKLMRLPYDQVVPLWSDLEHSEMHEFIRHYPRTVYEGTSKKEIQYAEYWTKQGVWYFVSKDKGLKFEEDPERRGPQPHFYVGDEPYNWDAVPLLWSKYNDDELPMAYYIREQVDEYNWQKSITADVLRDVVNFVYILRGYGGENMDSFVRELQDAMAIPVDADGDVGKLQADLNIDASMSFLEITRRDIFEFASAVDTQNPDLSALSGKAMRLRYSDLIVDCNGIAGSLLYALQRFKLFFDYWLKASGGQDFSSAEFTIDFNMDLPTDETEIFQNAQAAQALGLSNRTIFSNIPWVDDVDDELKRVKEQRDADEERFNEGYGFAPNKREQEEATA